MDPHIPIGLQPPPKKMVGADFGGLTTEPEHMGQEPVRVYIDVEVR